MDQHAIDEVLNRPLSQELLARDLARLAFTGLDGTPRSIPIGIVWNGTEIVMCTATNARKLPALRRNPAVALTIDTESHPPKVLLIRGRAELDVVDGIPEEYFQWNGTYQMTPGQRAEWEAWPYILLDSTAETGRRWCAVVSQCGSRGARCVSGQHAVPGPRTTAARA
ncbi:MAG TPA: pyridoxamine 5'-phosphate oxidase family protein, partial [Amycolatopsis sp.]|uniref:pyridoxamine 5'-phosphate oxidase family protein n=1 Tax=Amycolatopsis sp. TaxID=37632 RepID=UPI002B4715FC